MRQYGSADPARSPASTASATTRHILSDMSSLRALGWDPKRTRRLGAD